MYKFFELFEDECKRDASTRYIDNVIESPLGHHQILHLAADGAHAMFKLAQSHFIVRFTLKKHEYGRIPTEITY